MRSRLLDWILGTLGWTAAVLTAGAATVTYDRSGDVLPALAVANHADERPADVKHLGDSSSRHSLTAKATYIDNLSRSQFGIRTSFSTSPSPFGGHIGKIIDLCSKEKMSNGHAPRIIATRTVVQNAQVSRNRAVDKFPSYAMSLKYFPSRPSFGDTPMTEFSCIALPKDASRCSWWRQIYFESFGQSRSRVTLTAAFAGTVSVSAFLDTTRVRQKAFATILADALNFARLSGHGVPPLKAHCESGTGADNAARSLILGVDRLPARGYSQ